MTRWTFWDWVGRIGVTVTVFAVSSLTNWYVILLGIGVLMVITALLQMRREEHSGDAEGDR